jgi:hypothetical protein
VKFQDVVSGAGSLIVSFDSAAERQKQIPRYARVDNAERKSKSKTYLSQKPRQMGHPEKQTAKGCRAKDPGAT